MALWPTQIIYDTLIPTNEEFKKLKVGDLVKVLMVDKGYVKRVYIEVEVTGRDNDLFKGVLDNSPIEFENVNEGKIIYFHSNHVYEIDPTTI